MPSNLCAFPLQEAERLHQLRHANIVTLYGVCLAGPIGILLMVRNSLCCHLVLPPCPRSLLFVLPATQLALSHVSSHMCAAPLPCPPRPT